MANYKALISGLLLAVTLVNSCHAFPAESEVSADGVVGTSESNVEESNNVDDVVEETNDSLIVPTTESSKISAYTSEVYEIAADEESEDAKVDALVSSDDTDAESEHTESESTISLVSKSIDSDSTPTDLESTSSASESSTASESTSTDSDTIASGDKVQKKYEVTTKYDGQNIEINVSDGANIKDVIKVKAGTLIRPAIVEDALAIPGVAMSKDSDKLVLMKGRSCVERTYKSGAATGERTMTAAECRQAVHDMHRVERQAQEIARLQQKLDEIMNRPLASQNQHKHRGGPHKRCGHGKRHPGRQAA